MMGKKIETGQVEKGSASKQEMKFVDKSFSSFAFHTVTYKLLPTSRQNVTSDKLIRKYCTQCRAKIHQNDKFCAQCGNKL